MKEIEIERQVRVLKQADPSAPRPAPPSKTTGDELLPFVVVSVVLSVIALLCIIVAVAAN